MWALICGRLMGVLGSMRLVRRSMRLVRLACSLSSRWERRPRKIELQLPSMPLACVIVGGRGPRSPRYQIVRPQPSSSCRAYVRPYTSSHASFWLLCRTAYASVLRVTAITSSSDSGLRAARSRASRARVKGGSFARYKISARR